MRIAVVSTPFVTVPPRDYGGTELVVHELVRGLSAAGHEVVLFATGDSQARDVRWLFPHPVWPPDPLAEQRHCAAAARTIAGERFDLVHAHAPAALRWLPPSGPPLVYTLHHAHDPGLSALYHRRRDVHYVAISRRQAELEPGLDCHVIHHGLDPARLLLGAGDGGHVLFLGRLSRSKGPDVAMAAARRAGIPIVVGGDLHAADATPGWCERLDAALHRPGVRHVGRVGGSRKLSLLGRARALLLPLAWEEPFGLVMVEAMLSGTPVIAFPRGAAPEIIDEGVTGFLARDEAGMADLLRATASFDRAACRQRAIRRFGSARMIADHLRLYEAATAAAGRAAEGSSHAG